MNIIGITGTLGAGKGTIVDFLVKEKGYIHFSVREYLIGELKKRNLEINRDNMVALANEIRAQYSPAYIVEQLYKQAEKQNKNCVIESIRTPGEAELLKSKGKFILLAVDAPAEIRYKRIVQRASETDNVSYETFLENEKREMTSEDPNKQNLKKCIEMADFLIINDGTIEQLHEKINAIIH